MIRRRSLRWLSVGIVACLVIGVIVLLINSATIVASGVLWDVDDASDLEIGNEQEQIISGIEVSQSRNPVRIHVGELVDSGAELDHNATSYRIVSEKGTHNSGVHLKNPNSSNATVVISESVIPSRGPFDVHIEKIDTTNISRYNQAGSKINRAISYTAYQGGKESPINFNVFSPGSVDIDAEAYNETTRSISYDYSVNNNSESNLSVTIWEQKPDGDLGQRVGTVGLSHGNISLNGTDIEGKTSVAIGLHSPENKHALDAIYALDTAVINVTVPIQLARDPVYFNRNQTGSEHNSTLVFEFNTNVSKTQGRVGVSFTDRNATMIPLNKSSHRYEVDENLLNIYLNNTSSSPRPRIDSIQVDDILSTSSSVPLETVYRSPTRVATIATGNQKYTISRGSNIGFKSHNRDYFTLSKSNNTVREIETTNLNQFHTFTTDSLSTGNYSLRSNTNDQNSTIQIVEPTLNIETTDTVEGSHIQVHLGQGETRQRIILNVSYSNSEIIYRDEIILNKHSNVSRVIPVSQSGTYSVNIYDSDTNLSVSQEVEAVESKTPTIISDIDQSGSTGDILDFILNSTYNRSSVTLLSRNNSIAVFNLSTTGTGPTPITVNTYASPGSPSDFITTGSGVTVDSVTGNADPLSPGTYNLTLRSEHGTAVENDTVTVTIEPRSTSGLTAYTTGETAPGAFGNASAIRSAIADGTLTEATTATANDTVVYAVNATGLTGLPAAANASLDRGADLGRLDGLSFGVARTNTDAANASDGDGALGPIPNGSTVHLDRDGLFLVAGGETAFGTESPPADGETFEAGFRVDDDRLRRDGDGENRVTTRLTHVAPDSAGDPTARGGAEGPAATPPAGDEPTGSSGPSGTGTAGSGASSGSGAPTGSGGSGASTSSGASGGTTSAGGSAAADGAPGATGSPGPGGSPGGDSPGGGGRGAADGSRGSDGDRATTRPGAGGAADPGASEVPPAAGPPRPFATERTSGGAGAVSTPESRPTDGRPNGEGASGTDGETATEPTGSGDLSEASDSASDEAAASDLGYDDAPIRSTAYDLPGFGPVGSLAAVACVLLLVRRRT